MEHQQYATAASMTSLALGQPMLTTAPWPIEVCDNWPPYMCRECWGMKFFYNLYMAQCFYCHHIILNWGRQDDQRNLASPPGQ